MIAPAAPESPSLHEVLGDEIFSIFSEEVAEINQTLADLYPQWDKDRTDRGLLMEIRRGFHTLKGSGRMAGAFALGDFAWVHESLLNQVLGGQLAANDQVSSVIADAIRELRARETFFQTAQAADVRVSHTVENVTAFMEGKVLLPVLDQLVDDDAPEEDAQAQAVDTHLVWQLFWEEFPEQLQALDHNLQRLQANPSDHEIIHELEREFHTLKGGARMACVPALADVSHEAETLLALLPRSSDVSPAAIEALQESVDKLHALAEQARNAPAAATPTPAPVLVEQAPTEEETSVAAVGTYLVGDSEDESSSLLERILVEQADNLPDISVLGIASRPSIAAQAVNESTTPVGNHETIRLPAVFVDNLIDRVVGLNVQQVRLSEHFNGMGVDVDELIRTVARLRQQIRALELESEAQIHDGRSSRSSSSSTVVHSSGGEFDALELDQYAEIQRISRSLAESLNDLVNLESDLSSQLRKGEQLLQEDMRTTRQIQQDLLDTRLVALTMLVPRLRRLTRQMAAELGKQVTLEVQGEECELDRNLLQHMTGPLEHLIRNAVAHGIEMPDERIRRGKSPTGRITLSVSRDEAEIVIRFRDDGQGLDREQVRQRGVELSLLGADETLPDNELDRLILRPGFTTAKTVSQIAGRGIGMDVVHSELKALGGSLQIESRTGQGAAFSMRLPFTLIVNPVLLVDVDAQVFALPLSGIQGLARLSGADVQKVLATEEQQLEFAGEFYRVRQLAEVLGMGGIAAFPPEEMLPIVFFKLHEHTVAWVISRIRGRREVVLQPLGALFKDCRLYSAATVAPDGSVFLVPDMAELARRIVGCDSSVMGVAAASATPKTVSHAGPARILVVDDSITVRRVTEKFLNTQEYAVSTAKDGMEALEQIGDFLPDVVLLDIEMPRMDGFELLGHLRRDPQWRDLPVVMISSRTAQKHREHAVALGATGFLGKPYQNEILLSTLQSVLASGHVNDGERISA